MNPFSVTELSRMQATQEEAMQDTGQVLEYTVADVDGYGMPVTIYVDGPVTPCGFSFAKGGREVLGTGQVSMSSPRVRLPLSTTVKPFDRFKLTHRFGTALERPEAYDIIGVPDRGPSGIICTLQAVTTGSERE